MSARGDFLKGLGENYGAKLVETVRAALGRDASNEVVEAAVKREAKAAGATANVKGKSKDPPKKLAVKKPAPKSLAVKPTERADVAAAPTPTSLAVTPQQKVPATPRSLAVDIHKSLYGADKNLPPVQKMTVLTEDIGKSVPEVSLDLQDLVGRQFLSVMADRTEAGKRLLQLQGVDFNNPVDLLGGQNFMYKPTADGAVWANARNNAVAIRNVAAELQAKGDGRPPLILPFRMGGTGSDFAHMTGQLQMAYLDATLGNTERGILNNTLRDSIRDFKGVENPESLAQFAALKGDQRKAIQNMLAERYGDNGGLTLAQARAAIAQPSQLNAPIYNLQNVGELYPGQDLISASGHPSYDTGLSGRVLGTLSRDFNVAEFIPDWTERFRVTDPANFKGSPVAFTEAEKIATGLDRMDPGKAMRSGIRRGEFTQELIDRALELRRK